VVRLDGPIAAPVLMDASMLSDAALDRLCLSGSVVVMGRAEAARMGVPGGAVPPELAYVSERLHRLDARHCRIATVRSDR
jgi:hypothetical protein